MSQQPALPARGIVTPEAVRLEFAPASIGSRALALAIDFMALGIVLLALLLAVALVGAPFGPATAISGVLLVALAYPALFETLLGGRTPGKAALGLRVVTREGGPITLRHAAIRAALLLVDVYLTAGGAAVVSALATRQSQRLGDLVAGTLVLRERSARSAAAAVRFTVPPGWEAYAATLDPAVLKPAAYTALRAFLIRAQELDPDARRRVARDLADPLAMRLSHSPPRGVTAELFLLCLAARYQRRSASASWSGPAPPRP
jgi:uncharacterized RDD family membrane protein YckC